MAKIQGKEVVMPDDYLSPVTYIPRHADGDARHHDCNQGVIIDVINNDELRILYCRGRTVRLTPAGLLVWG